MVLVQVWLPAGHCEVALEANLRVLSYCGGSETFAFNPKYASLDEQCGRVIYRIVSFTSSLEKVIEGGLLR